MRVRFLLLAAAIGGCAPYQATPPSRAGCSGEVMSEGGCIPEDPAPPAGSGSRSDPGLGAGAAHQRIDTGFVLDSVPSGAAVFVDGAAVGVTPVRVTDVAAGDRVIRVHADGFIPWETWLHVVPDNVLDLPTARLVPVGNVEPGRVSPGLSDVQVRRVFDQRGYDELERCHAATPGSRSTWVNETGALLRVDDRRIGMPLEHLRFQGPLLS